MSWIRWWGLGAFVAIVGGAVALWLLFADAFVRWGIESAGTRMVGAKVEVAVADAGFSPARLELRGLAVTNPDAPMRNAVEVERLAFDIDWIGLLLDRVHIDEISVEGVRFGTERESSGAVLRTSRSREGSRLLASARERAEIPPLEVPSASEVLERESLRSPEVIAEARRTLEQRRTSLQQRIAELPGDKELRAYRERVDEATADGGDGLARLERLKALRDVVDDVRDDVKRLRRARDEVRTARGEAARVADEARKAPGADAQRLYRKYTDPAAVAGELAHYLLGPKVTGWINRGWYWYDRVSPWLGGADAEGGEAAATSTVPAARRPGRTVIYPGADVEPAVLIRRVRLSGAAGGGELDGRITDIASPATLWPEPLEMSLAGTRVGGIERLRMNAGTNRKPGEPPVTQLDLGALGARIAGLALGPGGALRASEGSADFRVSGLVRGDRLNLDLDTQIRGASFGAGDDAAPILREVAGALDGAGPIRIGARVGGTIREPELELDSSLDGLLEPMVRNRLKQAAGDFREQLAAAVRERTGGSLDEIERQAGRIDAIEAELEQRLGAYEDLLERARKPLD